MAAVLVTLALFLAWSCLGVACLGALGADTRQLRVALTAPTIGTAVTVAPLFVLSNAGVPMSEAAIPVFSALLGGSVIVLAIRRLRLPLTVAPVVAVSVLSVAVLAYPMFQFGFDWLANANGDMAFYVLAATHLTEHGLQSPVDYAALADNRGFASSAQNLHLGGLRPGSQIALAGVAALLGRPPLALYMPMLIALNMCGVCAAGALATQASRRWWAAVIAAVLLVASPLAGYGVLQQLMPQVWGLALSVALLSWLLRPELHQRPGPRLPDLFAIGILTAALFVVYVELGASIVVAYALYVALLIARRRFSIRAVALLWGVPLVAILIVVNTFLARELGYLSKAAQFGLGTTDGVRLFGYALVPTALPGLTGLQDLFAAPATRYMELSILAAAVLLAGVVIVCLRTALRGEAAAVALLGNLVLGVLLIKNSNDFGLFKLYMYVQPLLAATVAAWLAGLTRRVVLVPVALLLACVVGIQLWTLNGYVDKSLDPIDLPNASEPDLLPKFRRFLDESSKPVVSVTDHFVLGPLEGASAGDKRIYFVGRNLLSQSWQDRVFPIPSPQGETETTFDENVDASRLLSQQSCNVSLPTGSQLALNRRSLPEGSPDLVTRPCSETTNTLAFIVSSLGQPATVPEKRRDVSFWQLEGDPSFPGRSFSGFGRYALFQILDPTPGVRLALDFTTSSTQSRTGSYRLPPAAVAGTERVTLPVAGSGSARIFSPPLRPRLINGHPYLVLDMGREGEFPVVRRPGITGLWGKSVPLDPRALTSYVRDVSLVSADEYERLKPPLAIRRIPEDLANVNLEYSGIYEDGWVGRSSYAQLAGGRAGRLVVRALVLPRAEGQKLDVLVNGRLLESRRVESGELDLQLPLAASAGRRKIELRWQGVTKLAAPDRRSAAARLTFLGVDEPPG